MPYGSTVLLPEEGNAHDDHDHSIDYRGNDGRGPDCLLVTLGRHGEVEVGQAEVLISRGFALQKCVKVLQILGTVKDWIEVMSIRSDWKTPSAGK
jgi:hypothetical protein